ncbi:30S ribosomal protein S9 [Planctomicrobium sp. SH668]|uniref:30S ribosomal protein S9 n=1 Tax=Planctomicrobium sp. SH668 TaxID=3448126 RepID=UPI003F5BE4DC
MAENGEHTDSPELESSAGLASGLDIGSEASAVAEEAAPYFEPIIRGKIDRFGVALGTGRRKTSVARVRIKDGSGKIVINGRPLEAYFPVERDQGMIFAPLHVTSAFGKVDIEATVQGGGSTGQTGAVVLGIARALQAKNPANHSALSEGGFLTRDSRMVERKKYGKAGARRSFQFSKR